MIHTNYYILRFNNYLLLVDLCCCNGGVGFAMVKLMCPSFQYHDALCTKLSPLPGGFIQLKGDFSHERGNNYYQFLHFKIVKIFNIL